jgi:hypothetical protein
VEGDFARTDQRDRCFQREQRRSARPCCSPASLLRQQSKRSRHSRRSSAAGEAEGFGSKEIEEDAAAKIEVAARDEEIEMRQMADEEKKGGFAAEGEQRG